MSASVPRSVPPKHLNTQLCCHAGLCSKCATWGQPRCAACAPTSSSAATACTGGSWGPPTTACPSASASAAP